MLEKYIASLLVPYLSKYVENVNEQQLSIDIWSGKASLNDLILKKDVLNSLLDAGAGDAAPPMPLRVHRGVCKTVTLEIPIKNLRSRPVVLNIDELLITLVAADEGHRSTEQAAGARGPSEALAAAVRRAAAEAAGVAPPQSAKSLRWDSVAARKAKRLDAFEEERKQQQRDGTAAAAAAAAGPVAESKSKSGFFSQLAELVVNNLIVRVKTVHVRYEDRAHRVVLGAVLGGVQLLTVDDSTGEATFVDPSAVRRMGKRLDIQGLQLYCDDPKHLIANELLDRCWLAQITDWQDWYHAMKRRVRDDNVALSTVFGPVSCSVDARVVRKQFTQLMLDTPYASLSVAMQPMIARLTRLQYTTIVKTISRFTNWSEVAQVTAQRPRVPVAGNATVWWKFAIRTVLEVLARPREERVMQRISETCRMDYQVLYRDVVRKTEMSAEKKKSYRFITRFMTVEDMIAGRRYVYAQLANEINLRRKDNEARKAQVLQQQQQQEQEQRQQDGLQRSDSAVSGPSSPQSTGTASPTAKRGWLQWLRGAPATEPKPSVKEDTEEELLRGLEKDYGISRTDGTNSSSSSLDDGDNTAPGLSTSPYLPPNYTWLFLTFQLPLMSCQIDMESGESACLSLFQLYGQVSTFNKLGAKQFHLSALNLTLSNPASDDLENADGDTILENLIEGVTMKRRSSVASATSSPGLLPAVPSRYTRVKSIAEFEAGKPRGDQPPTLREMLGLPSIDRSNLTASTASEEEHRTPRSSSSSSSRSHTALLSLSGSIRPVEQPLADTKLDLVLSVRLLPLRIVADPGIIHGMVHFFRAPRGVDLARFKSSTRVAASAVSTAASAELRTAMADAKGIFIALDASAPIILLPKTLRDGPSQTTVALSLGRVRFQSQPLSETEKARRLESAQGTEDMLYYSSRANFSKFFMVMTTLGEALEHPETGVAIVPNLAVVADVLQRIDDRNDRREKVIVRLKVPRLSLACSVHQVYLVTSLVDAWVRSWDSPPVGVQPCLSVAALRQRSTHPDDADDAEFEATGGDAGGGRAGAMSLSQSLSLSWQASRGRSPQHAAQPLSPLGTSSALSLGAPTSAAATVAGGGSANRSSTPRTGRTEAMGRRSSSGQCTGSSSPLPVGAPAGSSGGATAGALASSAGGAGAGRARSPTGSPLGANNGLAGLADDLPVFRLELLVEHLGLDLHEDDRATQQPVSPPRFSLTFHNSELILAVRSAQKRIVVYLKEPCVRDQADLQHPILCGTSALRIDVGLPHDAPTAVGVILEPSVHVRLGTSFIEVVEAAMDVVNLILACIDEASAQEPSPPAVQLLNAASGASRGGGLPAHSTENDFLDRSTADDVELAGDARDEELTPRQRQRSGQSDLDYQLSVVRASSAVPDVRTLNLSIHIDGSPTFELFNRRAGDTEDSPFATVAASGATLFLKKNRVTMELSGKVGPVAATLAECHGLLPENNVLLQHRRQTPSRTGQHSRSSTSSTPGSEARARNTVPAGTAKDPPLPDVNNADARAAAEAPPVHVAFTYRRGRPVMPIFMTETDGKRVLSNASELRFSNAVELELDGSTVSLDLQTVMVLKLYFTTGFFSRLFSVGDRPLYSGQVLPPAPEGPRLLTGLRIIARDLTLALPLDARQSAETINATVRNLVVQSSLHAAEAHQTTSISFRGLSLEKSTTAADDGHWLLPALMNADVALRSPIDEESDEPSQLVLKSDDLALSLRSDDLLDLCQLVRQNFSRTAVEASASVAAPCTHHVLSTAASGSGVAVSGTRLCVAAPPRDNAGEDAGMVTDIFFGKISLSFSGPTGEDRGETDTNHNASRAGSGASIGGDASFEVQAVNIGLLLESPSNAISLEWQSLELLDTRNGVSSALVRCDEGDAHMANSLTTRTIVMSDFGVRQTNSSAVGDSGSRGVEDDDSALATGAAAGGASLGRLGLEAVGAANSHSGSTVTASPSAPGAGSAADSKLRQAEAGVESSRCHSRRHRNRHDSITRKAAAQTAPGTELLSMSVLSVAFTLRRFAVSDQWLSLYDFFCNESLATAWSSPLSPSSCMLDSAPSGTGTGITSAKADPFASPLAGPGATPTDKRARANNSTASISSDNDGRGRGSVGGFRCVVTTPSVVVPFLTAHRSKLIEASIGSLLVDTVSFPGGETQVVTRLQELEVVDCKSGEKIISRRHRPSAGTTSAAAETAHDAAGDDDYGSPEDEEDLQSPLSPLATGELARGSQWGTTATTAAAAAATAGGGGGGGGGSGVQMALEPEALHFLFRSEPTSRKNRLYLRMGRLDAVCSLPLIYSIVEFFVSPTQPIAQISALGVMREQRVRMARAAQEMTSNNVMSMRVVWHQPRIIMVGDGMDLKNRSRRLEARLGTMRATVTMDRPNNELGTSVTVHDFSIPGVLEKSALDFLYSVKGNAEEVKVTLERMVGLFFPTDVERVAYVLYGNLLLPRETKYYGAFGATVSAGSPMYDGSFSPSAAPSNSSPLVRMVTNDAATPLPSDGSNRPIALAPDVKRTVLVQINGLVLEVHDVARVNTHTVTLSSLSLRVTPTSDVAIKIPTVRVVEHFSNCSILSSGEPQEPTSDPPAAPPSDAASTPGAAPAAQPKPKPVPAVAMTYSHEDSMTTVAVSNVVVSLVPRGTGSLVNTLLSVQIPHIATVGSPLASGPASARVESPASAMMPPPTPTLSSAHSGAVRVPAPTTKQEASRGRKALRTLVCVLSQCGLRFIHGDADIAFANFSHVGVTSESFKDGSSLLRCSLDDFTLEDAYSVNASHKQLIGRFVDDSGEGEFQRTKRTSDKARKLLDFTLWTAAAEEKLSRTLSISRCRHGDNLYAKRVFCELDNLSFTIIPDVTKALSNATTEMMQYVSDANRGRAHKYVSDTATAAAQAVASETVLDLTALDVTIHRPRFVVLHTAQCESGLELFPGQLVVKSALGLPGPAPPAAGGDGAATSDATDPARRGAKASPMLDQYREIFRVKVDKMGMRLLNIDAFKEECHVSIVYQSALPAPPSIDAILAQVTAEVAREVRIDKGDTDDAGSPASATTASAGGDRTTPVTAPVVFFKQEGSVDKLDETTSQQEPGSPSRPAFRKEAELHVAVPRLSMNLTDEQTQRAMEIVGAYLNDAAASGNLPTAAAGSDAAGRRRRGTNASVGGSPLTGVGPSSPSSTTFPTRRTPAGGEAVINTVARQHKKLLTKPPPKNPQATFRLSVDVGFLEADLSEVFRIHFDDTQVRTQSSHANGSHVTLWVKRVLVQHVGAQVEATLPNGTIRSTRVDDLVDLLTVDKVAVESRMPPTVVDVESRSVSETRTTDVSLGGLKIAVSPTILFDTREVLYLPFCAMVLRQPIEPIPVLKLEADTTVLPGDVVLDNMHVLLTCNRKRCCYHLDLNRHRLVLTGAPTGQIVLNEGCELIISNGTIVVPGMYSIGSFVSYGLATALFTTDTCRIEKQYLYIANSAFATCQDEMKLAASAALVAGGGDGSRAAGAGARPSPTYRSGEDPGTVTLLESSLRTVSNLSCESVVVEMLSEETRDLSTSLVMEANISFVQDFENDVTVRRNLSVQLLELSSGENEEHTLLPTSVTGNLSGVESVSLSIVLGPLKFCSRAVLLRSFVEIAKDFGAAFLEETTVVRLPPTVQLETQDFTPLYSVTSVGECEHCGEKSAYLSEAANTPGTLCCRCCTGRESMPAMDFRLEIPLVDAVVLAASGDLAHAFVRNVVLAVDPNMDMKLGLRAAVHNFSNAAAVWEPFVEQFDGSVVGSVLTRDYRIRIDRLDWVISPLNMRISQTLIGDYNSTATLQKRLRKKFRRRTQQQADVTYNNAPMFVDESASDEDARADATYYPSPLNDEDSRRNAADNDEDLLSASASNASGLLANKSIFDYMAASQRQSVNKSLSKLEAGPAQYVLPDGSPTGAQEGLAGTVMADQPQKVYARVLVENLCSVSVLVQKKPVGPRGGKVSFKTDHRQVLVEREQPLDPSDKGIVTSLTNPALYVQTKEFLMETKVVITRDNVSRMLKRTVHIKVLPLHASKTLIGVENKLGCCLSPGHNLAELLPGDRFYFAPQTDLSLPLTVRPTNTYNGFSYEPGVPASGKTPSIQDVLTSLPLVLTCKATRTQQKSSSSAIAAAASAAVPSTSANDAALDIRVVVRQESIRGGVPTFIISIEPHYRLSNKLPFCVTVETFPDKSGDVFKGKSCPAAPLQSLVMQPLQKSELNSAKLPLESITFTLQVRQLASAPPEASAGAPASPLPQSSGGSALPGKSARPAAPRAVELFTSPPSQARPGLVTLRSNYGREMVIKVLVVHNTLLLTAPFTFVNHTDYTLSLRECDAKGQIRRVNVPRNYSTLLPSMSTPVSACPVDSEKEEFFAHVYSGCFTARTIPFHVQQRGLILMEENLTPEQAKAKAAAAKQRAKKHKSKHASTKDDPEHTMLHLAYVSRVDVSGSVLVTITPRWIMVNRSSKLSLCFVPTKNGGVNALEATAAARAEVTAEEETGHAASTPNTEQKDVDAFKNALLQLAASDDTRLDDVTYVVAVRPNSAQPLYKTPYCPPELGYHAYILQSAAAPLYGNPTQLETIHNEMIMAYQPRPDSSDDDDDNNNNNKNNNDKGKKKGTEAEGAVSDPSEGMLARPGAAHLRDRYFEITLVTKNSYTYVIAEEPKTTPFLMLNRTRYLLEARDTAKKCKGRLMASAAPGCGTALLLDTTVSTLVAIFATPVERAGSPAGSRPETAPFNVQFDFSRPMTTREHANPPHGILYTLNYGSYGQLIVEIEEAKPAIQVDRTSRAVPPPPIDILLNIDVFTVAMVIPNRDVVFAAIMDTRFSWERAKYKEKFSFSVKNYQFDNQTEITPRYDSCVLALRKKEDSTSISGSFVRTIVAAKTLLWFDEVRLDLAPIALRVSDTLLVILFRFFRMLREGDDVAPAAPGAATVTSSASFSISQTEFYMDKTRCPTMQDLFNGAPVQMDYMATRIVLDKFIINPLLIRLWFTREVDESNFFRDEIRTKEASLLSMLVASCEDVNISAPGLATVHRSSRLGVFLQWIIKSYADGLLAQLRGVLLQYASSLPLIGAPVKLFSGIGSGAVRLYREPVEGLSTSSSAFAKGLARGSGGLAAGFAGGGLGAFSNLANAGSRLLSIGGGVSEQERRKQNTLTGFASGIAGIVQRPMEGAAESGAKGFAKGAAQGLVGIIANPFSGFLSDIARGTDTMAKLVTDTYIPKTHRLRPIRTFHANGGVAPWRAIVSVFQYERQHRGTTRWSSEELMSSVDGPEWYPCTREEATYGKEKRPVPATCWVLDRYSTNFEGWTFSTKYYSYYTGLLSDDVRVRRKRWTALVRPLPYSPVASFLGISPGMALPARVGATRTASYDAGSISGASEVGSEDEASPIPMLNRHTTSTTLDYVTPGMVPATTAAEDRKRHARTLRVMGLHRGESGPIQRRTLSFTSSHSEGSGSHRAETDFFSNDEYQDRPRSVRQRMRRWTSAGRSVGIQRSEMRSKTMDIAEDVEYSSDGSGCASDGSSGLPPIRQLSAESGDFQRPSQPRSGRFRGDRPQRRSGSGSNSDRGAGALRGREGSQIFSPRTARGAGGGGAGAAGAAATTDDKSSRSSKSPEAPALHQRVSSYGPYEAPVIAPVSPPEASSPATMRPVQRLSALEYSSALPATTVELIEYEKKTPLLGWGKRYLPSDVPPWQDAHGRAVPSRTDTTLPSGWRWANEWKVVDGDANGWTTVDGDKSVRRRKWRRTMMKASTTAAPPAGGVKR